MDETEQLQAKITEMVRAFGLHRPETTPCGQPITVSEAHALMEVSCGWALFREEGDAAEHLGTCSAAHQPKELCRRLRLDKSTVSRILKRLEERGWISRTADPADGRAIHLALTEAGQKALENLEGARATKYSEVLASIPSDERDAVLRALDVLADAMRDADRAAGLEV